jgi:2-oxoacid:acceptor oxidoreductase gamma subunit (pyruvate/2-ketoisovalerate family)
VVASKLLASAFFRDGWQVQAFPSFGAERTGAPVMAFLRVDHRAITSHYQVYEPDHVIVLDPVLLKTIDVTIGLRPGGWIIVNSPNPPSALDLPDTWRVATCDATRIALDHHLGSRTTPIVNTAIAGAFAAATGLVTLASVQAAIPDVVPNNPAANQAAAATAFGLTQVRAAAVELTAVLSSEERP